MTEADNKLTWFLLWLAMAVVYCAAVEVCHAEKVKTGMASFYGREACQWNPDAQCPTASGHSLYDLERHHVLYAAMWGVPFGSSWRVCRLDQPARCTQVIIWDRGPHPRLHRLIDLNPVSFARLAPLGQGIIPVSVERVE